MTSERKYYAVLAVLVLCSLIALWPLVKVMIGILALLVFMTYGFLSVRLGLPLLLHCGNFCGR